MKPVLVHEVAKTSQEDHTHDINVASIPLYLGFLYDGYEKHNHNRRRLGAWSIRVALIDHEASQVWCNEL